MNSIDSNNRMLLKDLTSGDIDAFMSWATDDAVTKTLMWDSYHSRDEALSFLRNIAEKHPWFKAICNDGKVIGSITLDKGKGIHACKAELGYVISRANWSKGYATKAIKEVLKEGFSDLDIVRIEAYVDPDNIASVRALEKAGFTCEGRLKNYVIHKGTIKDRLIFSFIRPS